METVAFQPTFAPSTNAHVLTIIHILAQLGALKLKCNRSFISLIDRHNQYIIGR